MILYRTKNSMYRGAFAIFMVIVMTVCCTPILNRGVLFGLLSIFSLFFIIVTPRIISKGKTSTLFCVAGFLFLMLFYRLIGYSNAIVGRYILLPLSLLILQLTPLVGEFSFYKNSNRVWIVSVFICVFNIAWNIFMAYQNPEIHEFMDSFSLADLNNLNIGGSDFYTFSLFFYILTLFLYINLNKKKSKLIMLLCALVSGVFILGYCFKASVVVLMILSTVLLFLLKGKTRLGSIPLALTIFFVIIVLLFALFSNEIIGFIVKYSPSERLTYRIVGLINADSDYANTASLEAREDLWLLSLNTWLANPLNFLIGVGDHYMPGGNNDFGVGQHSEFLDLLASYGIIGGLLVFIMLKRCWSYIVSLFDKSCRIQVYMILLVYVIFGFTRTVFIPSVSCVLYILLPLASNYVNKKLLE